jgi:hypothetical protein
MYNNYEGGDTSSFNAANQGGAGPKAYESASSAMLIDQLRQRLVRYCVKYHEELSSKQEVINSSAATVSVLEQDLKECASALISATELLQQIPGVTIPENIAQQVNKFKVPMNEISMSNGDEIVVDDCNILHTNE